MQATDPPRPFEILYVDTEQVWRGGQQQLLDLMTGMTTRGHSVWLAARNTSALFQRASEGKIKVVHFQQRHELSLLACYRIWRILTDRYFDIVHSNTPRPLIAVGLAARLARTPVVLCSRRVDFPLRSRLSAIKYNWATDRIFPVSSSIQRTLARGGVKNSKIQVVYEGVDLQWIDKQQTGPLTKPEGVLGIGTVAHMSPEKGHAALLEAIGILRHKFPRVHLYLVGDGSLKGDLVKKTKRLGIEEFVTFTGFRTDSEALMKQFAVFCLPSLSEGLSSAILAAMASRLPVVSTKVGGIPELVADGSTGFLVPPGDPKTLATALGKLLGDPALRTRMGEAGRKRIEDHVTVSQKLQATENSYLELLRAKGIS